MATTKESVATQGGEGNPAARTHQDAVCTGLFVKLGGEDGQQIHLYVTVVAASEDDVLQYRFGVNVEALGNLAEALWAAVAGLASGGRVIISTAHAAYKVPSVSIKAT